MNKKSLYLSSLFFFAFVWSLVSFGDYTPGQLEPNWPVTLGPEEECEEVVAYFNDQLDSIARDLSGWESYYNNLSDSHEQVYEMATDTNFSPAYTNNPSYAQRLDYYNNVFQNDMILLAEDLRYANETTTNLLDRVNQINCHDCVIGDQPGGPTNSNACCDFTGLYARLDELIRLQTLIESKVQHLQRIEKHLNDIRLSLLIDEWNVYEYQAYHGLTEQGYEVLGLSYLPYDPTIGNYLMAIGINLAEALPYLNNYHYQFTQILWPTFTNEFNYVSKSFKQLQSPSPLLYFDSDVDHRDYYTYLTNYYFAMVRGDGDISANHKTNWFTRIETLLAALVFADGAKTNYYESATDSLTNSIQQVKEEFTNLMDGISESPTDQMQLVESVERSMYENLRSFSSAFSDASLPSSVQIIHVHKGLDSRKGSRLLSTEEIEISADISGRLMDFLEILRSATTFCWVFLGLWFMFKFAVWTVKKIYVLIRYVIDFFNMIVGGK